MPAGRGRGTMRTEHTMRSESIAPSAASMAVRLKPLFMQGGFSWHGFVARGLASLVLNTLVAIGITVFGDHEFTLNLLLDDAWFAEAQVLDLPSEDPKAPYRDRWSWSQATVLVQVIGQ